MANHNVVQFADDVHFFPLDGEGLLLSTGRQEIHVLNLAATFVWTQLRLAQPRAKIVEALADGLGLTADRAASELDNVVDQWRILGLLRDSPAAPVLARPDPAADPGIDAPPPPLTEEQSDATERTYRALDTTFLIRYANPELESSIHPVLADLEAEVEAPSVEVEVVKCEGYVVYRHGTPVERCEHLHELAPIVKDLLWQSAINAHEYFLYVHAGVVGTTDGALLLPGASGSGKSTLTAALARTGFDYLSDEVALIDDQAFEVRAAPQSLCIKEPAWDLVAGDFPDLWEQPVHIRKDGRTVRYLPPPPSSHPGLRASVPVRMIVFPRYQEGAETTIRPLSRVEALGRILRDCLAVPVAFDEQNVGRLVAWIARLDCRELVQSSLEDAADLIRSQWEARTRA